jgi:hypothetical protein
VCTERSYLEGALGQLASIIRGADAVIGDALHPDPADLPDGPTIPEFRDRDR